MHSLSPAGCCDDRWPADQASRFGWALSLSSLSVNQPFSSSPLKTSDISPLELNWEGECRSPARRGERDWHLARGDAAIDGGDRRERQKRGISQNGPDYGGGGCSGAEKCSFFSSSPPESLGWQNEALDSRASSSSSILFFPRISSHPSSFSHRASHPRGRHLSSVSHCGHFGGIDGLDL